ncbi:MAG: hypothetical protein Q8N35_02660 [Methylococcaceae bacterium]|nr:hypothetical protein [Methylococcaceae bacterium]MDP2394069.1 hypothetical protein [Methylococcaceae bacterium]MDP3018467.1 hypothetical protein [Methylococcaceae bacterium]MDP3392137.1 hypothetical protein [Methylococcaceae bacterium]MDZ4156883.1 hypothetical protein [Methylococcales bacterium]
MQTSLSKYLLPATLTLLLTACASDQPAPPEPEPIISGELMLRESQGIASLGDNWKKGKQLTERGNVLVREGQAKITEGNRLIDEGNRIMRESEETYKGIKK